MLKKSAYVISTIGSKCKSKNRIDGKVVIITGSNCGIGYETALELAKRGGHVILACRDKNKAEAAIRKIILETGNVNVEFELIDLNSLQSIKEFSEKIKSKYERLDILINNAGLSSQEFIETRDGFERTFGVNHLAHFYLTNLLLDLIKASAPSRIVNVSSRAHLRVKDVNWDECNLKEKFSTFGSYSKSKLANVLFTAELAKRLKDSRVTVVGLHPGFVRTEIFRDYKGKFTFGSLIFLLMQPIFWMTSMSSRDGAQTSIHCAISDEVIAHNGKYFSDCKVCPTSKDGQNMELAEKLWNTSMKLVELHLV